MLISLPEFDFRPPEFFQNIDARLPTIRGVVVTYMEANMDFFCLAGLVLLCFSIAGLAVGCVRLGGTK